MENYAWSLPVDALLAKTKTSERGLKGGEVAERLKEYGPNEVDAKEKLRSLKLLASQFRSPFIIVLILASLIAYFLGDRMDALVIIAIVLLNSLLGFFQEYRAEQAAEKLKKYLVMRCRVMRDGKKVEIDSKDIVPGDIVYFDVGDIIPADIRIIHCEDLTTDESSLTGESLPVSKQPGVVDKQKPLPQDLGNMLFMGTSVSSGYGHGVVTSTGVKTFFGKTASILKQKQPDSDFHKGLRSFSEMTMGVVFAMVLFIFFTNTILGKGAFDSFLFALALAVGIIPESLPIIMTLTLSDGALKMAKEDVIMKRLASVEDLGNMDTLCCDKTGTLTEGRISLADHLSLDGKKDDRVLIAGMLCNLSSRSDGKRFFGNPIDVAIREHPHALELEGQLENYKVVDQNEFDYDRKRVSVVVKMAGGHILIVKGASYSILSVCSNALIKAEKVKLSRELVSRIDGAVADYENRGFRVILIAEKRVEKAETTKGDEWGLTLTGYLLFLDPPKKTAGESLRLLNQLGVAVKVISGDSQFITRKICNDVGLSIVEDRVITGDDLEKLSDAQLADYAMKYNVFARIIPEQKYKLVASLNRSGHTVGFLGDGVNDAPALRAADVGISVDSGTDIAKASAGVVLLKKNLTVLAQGVIEGRKTFSNITKYIFNTISANYGNMLTVALSSLFLDFIPLLPSQILLNNFISDLPLLTVSTDNVDKDTLRRPRKWDISLISKFMIFFGVISAVFDMALILPLLFILKVHPSMFRTAWFVESSISEIIVTFAIRTKRAFYKSRPSNLLIVTSILAIFATIAITYTSMGAIFFEFIPMPIGILALIAEIILAYFVTAEVGKIYFFKKVES